jgi:hypothetical protein
MIFLRYLFSFSKRYTRTLDVTMFQADVCEDAAEFCAGLKWGWE